jgi:plastocyanin
MLVPAAPASAVHLFPLTPNFDPAGHDCAKNLVAAPPGSAATVSVSGFSFSDSSGDSETSVVAGESITWRWDLDHCHSVTFDASLGGTKGAGGFQPPQPELVRLNGTGQDSFTLRFDKPGTFDYLCVHHASVGMRGRVVVTPRPGPPPNGPTSEPALKLRVRPSVARARRSTSFAFTVTAAGAPVSGARVRLAKHVVFADEQGRAVIVERFNHAARYRPRATKPGYREARAGVRVLPPRR